MREPRDAAAELQTLMTERAGLSFEGTRGRWLREALARHGGRLASPAARDVLVRLRAGEPEAFAGLCDLATVQESFFFRERRALDLVRDEVLPSLGANPVRVWSAGCAGGEEPYTLAMLLTEAGFAGRFTVLGTDLSPKAVATARRAIYSAWSLRGVDEAAVEAGFTCTAGGYEVRPRFRAPVSLRVHNLLDPSPPPGAPFDLVLCRNVLIYLTPAAAQRAIQRCAAALRVGGWLLTGVSDPLPDVPGLEAVVTDHGVAYRRVEAREAAPVRTTPTPTPSPAAETEPAPAVRRARQPVAPRPAVVRERRTDVHAAGLAEAEEALLRARPAEAERLARLALADRAARRVAHHVLVRALADDGRLAEALQAAEAAVSELPDAPELRGVQAVLLLEAGRAAEAAVAARQAAYLDPEQPLAHVALARALSMLGDEAGARRARRNGHLALAPEVPR